MSFGPKPVRCLSSIGPLLLLTLGLGACGPGSSPDSESPQTDAIKAAVVSYAVPFECVNEVLQPLTPIHSGLTYFAIYTPLAEEGSDYEQGQPSFHPRLAERWEFSPDRMSLTFYLRKDVVWSDGQPLTAEDVRFTWQAQSNADIGWAYMDIKRRIRDVEVVDEHTARFHFTEVYPQQLFDASQGVIMPKHVWQELPFDQWRNGCDWFNERAVSSGPFLLESLESGQRTALIRNPNYFEKGLPHLDRVVIEVTPDRSNQTAGLRAGESHFVEFVDYSDAAQLEADPAIHLDTYIPRNYYFVAWNNTRAPFDSANVRNALTLAIDRQTIIDTLFYGYGKISYSPFASDIWVHNKDLAPLPYDPGKAKEMLAAEGFADTDGDGILERDGSPFTLELLTNSENSLRQQIAVMLQSQLQQVGIEASLRTMDFRSLVDPVVKQDFDAVISGLSIGTDLDMSYNFHTRGISQEGLNWSAFSDPETDSLIEQVNAEEDFDTRKQLFDQIQARLHQLQPMTFLYEGQRLYAVRDPLSNVKPNTVSSFVNMREWRLKP